MSHSGSDPAAAAWRVELTREGETLEQRLAKQLSDHPGCAPRLDEAMAYSLMGGGKRLRPVLCLWTYDALQDRRSEDLWRAAMALEMLHSYSLIHDDLPAMDDDDLRRGQPSNHRRFDEATAILAGDALQTEAFVLLGAMDDAAVAARCTALLAAAAGRHGMAGGQQLDLVVSHGEGSLDDMLGIHRFKTGALLGASLALGAACAGSEGEALVRLGAAGVALGVAFQIVDDLLDESGEVARIGKSPGKDRAQGKLSATRVLEPAEAWEKAQSLLAGTQHELEQLGLLTPRLKALTQHLVDRDR